MPEGDGYLRSLHSFLLDKFVPFEDFFDCVVPGSLEEAGCPDTFNSSTGKDIGQIRVLFEGINRNGCVVAADGIRSAAGLSLSEWIEQQAGPSCSCGFDKSAPGGHEDSPFGRQDCSDN